MDPNTLHTKKANPPAFLLSLERSGSTLLRYILDSHPELGAPGELALGMLCANLLVVQRRLLNADTPARDPTLESAALQATRTVIDSLMRSYLQTIKKSMWCDKAPLNIRYLLEIQAVFPDAKFIILYRNCLDTAASSIEVGALGFMPEQQSYIMRNPGNFMCAMVENWLDKTEQLLRFEKAHHGQAVRVRYEDLVTDSAATARRIFEFLGLYWMDEILEMALSTPHFQGGGDPKVAAESKIHARSLGRGGKLPLSMLPPDLIRRVDRVHAELCYSSLRNPLDWSGLVVRK